MESSTILKPDILTVLGKEGVELKQRGRSLWALCPFHSERTPSFCVDLERRRWKCFGCGASGDVVDFIMKSKGLSFRASLKYLGISNGDVRPTKPNLLELKKRELIEKFKAWCGNYTKYLCEMLRLCAQVDALVKISDDLRIKGLGEMYMMRDIYQYHLSVLESKNDELKFQMYKEVSNGRRI